MTNVQPDEKPAEHGAATLGALAEDLHPGDYAVDQQHGGTVGRSPLHHVHALATRRDERRARAVGELLRDERGKLDQ